MSANRFTAPHTLESFVRWFLTQRFQHMCAQEFYDYGSVLSLILYRDPPWQAELFILRPNNGFPRDHRHPDVDSYEYALSDSLPLIVNGKPWQESGGEVRAGTLGDLCRVGAEDWHRVGDIPHGGTFISLQEWKNGVRPTSVGKNWEGAPVSDLHKKLLREPDSKWVKTIRKPLRPAYDDPELIRAGMGMLIG